MKPIADIMRPLDGFIPRHDFTRCECGTILATVEEVTEGRCWFCAEGCD